MATTTTLSRPAVVINSVDYSDQCTSATLTITEEALEATTFADSARKYTAGLTNVEFTCTMMLAYDTAEVEANLEGLVGTTTTIEVYATNSVTPAQPTRSTRSRAHTWSRLPRSTPHWASCRPWTSRSRAAPTLAPPADTRSPDNMQMDIDLDLGDGPLTVHTTLFSWVLWERKFNRRVSDIGEKGLGLEDMAYLAYEGCKQAKVIVPATFDAFLLKIVDGPHLRGEPMNNPTEAAPTDTN
jgi:hypothetical protein